MTTTRYFEVKVTSCKDCTYKTTNVSRGKFWCRSASGDLMQGITIYEENKEILTDSCPMWNKTKESETK